MRNRVGGGERVGELLWGQMRCERCQRVSAKPWMGNHFGVSERVGECLGFLTWRQIRCERYQRVYASVFVAYRFGVVKRFGELPWLQMRCQASWRAPARP